MCQLLSDLRQMLRNQRGDDSADDSNANVIDRRSSEIMKLIQPYLKDGATQDQPVQAQIAA